MINNNLQFDVITCATCGCVFAMEKHFEESLQKSGKGFYCPNGHSLTFGKGEVEKLKEKLEAQQRETKKQIETARLTARGECPVCKRSFKNIVGHIQKKHPSYVA